MRRVTRRWAGGGFWLACATLGACGRASPPAAPVRANEAPSLRLHAADVERVRVNGVEIALLDVCPGADSRPTMLFAHGGPGSSEMTLVHRYAAEVCRFARLVLWDQRGAGRSFSEANVKSLSVDVMVRDGLEVARQALARSGQSRAILVGNSWGSFLGARMFASDPTRFCGYVGISQVVSVTEWGDVEGCVRRLGAAWPFSGPAADSDAVFARMQAVAHAGGFAYGATDVRPIQAMRDASPIPLLDSERAGDDQRLSLGKLRAEVSAHDLRQDVPRAPGKMAFVSGEADCVTPPGLVDAYAKRVNAPVLRIAQAAHMPHAERPRETWQAVERLTRGWCGP